MGKKSEAIAQPLGPKDLNAFHFGEQVTEEFLSVETLFHINKVEDAISFINFPLQPHRKTVFDFIFLTAGESKRSKNLTSYVFVANQFFFLPAMQISSHEYLTKESKGFYCHFHPEIFNSISTNSGIIDQFKFYDLMINPILEISEKNSHRYINILNRLWEEFASNKLKNKKIIASYLMTLLFEIDGVANKSGTYSISSSQKITDKYKELLSINIFKLNKVSQYASMMAITPDHLNKCVKNSLGCTAQELLSQMIILEAKILLKQSDMTASEIAFKFFESNPSDFARFFKKQSGMSPIEYRKMANANG